VTQCAALDEFGLFLVLADKSLFAYDIEALVPSSPQSARTSHLLQKLNRSKDVQFFRIGRLEGRTLVICMAKKGVEFGPIALAPEPISRGVFSQTVSSPYSNLQLA